jgi:hypothetical protein
MTASVLDAFIAASYEATVAPIAAFSAEPSALVCAWAAKAAETVRETAASADLM